MREFFRNENERDEKNENSLIGRDQKIYLYYLINFILLSLLSKSRGISYYQEI